MSRFEELAKSLAQPMSRSRALRLLGGAVVAASVPSVWTRPSVASPYLRGRLHSGTPCSSLCTTVKGSKPCGITGTNIYGETNCYLAGCMAPGEICCHIGTHSNTEPGVYICPKNYRCGTTPKRPCIGCPSPTQFLCGETCCTKKFEVCEKNKCRSKCSPKTSKCGNFCCERGQDCQNGACCKPCVGGKCCKPGESCCGPTSKRTCCSKTMTCCGQTCCPKGQACCTGSKLAPTCCKPGEVCAPKPNAKPLSGEPCCPKIRLANATGQPVCCPVGTIEIDGNCCPSDDLGCCDTPCEEKEICVRGTCVPISPGF